MSDDLRKIESKIYKKLESKSKHKHLDDGFNGNKVVNQVLDKSTIMTLYHMINSHIISYVNGPVSAGKESVVFWAVDENKQDVALKIYLVSTSNFKKRAPYIVGDPRFSKFKKGTRSLVYLWAKKEYRNLSECFSHNLPVPKPIHVSNNVLAMSFIGNNGVPANRLVDTDVDENDYKQSISFLKDLYQKTNLVHGDYSEYNIFKTDRGLVVFDLGSAVDLQHPNSTEFLKRDINNITKFFSKRDVTVDEPSDVLEEVLG